MDRFSSKKFSFIIVSILWAESNAFVVPERQYHLNHSTFYKIHSKRIRKSYIIKAKKVNEPSEDEINKNVDENKEKKKRSKGTPSDILSLLSNPYKAGKELRKTLNTALESLAPGLSPEQKSIYLDDRFLEPSSSTPSKAAIDFAQRNPLFDRIGSIGNDEYIPEVLVIGATGAIGRLVVRRLILSGRFKVRVLVRDLYSETLNMLGTGVTYCQGDLHNIESLEYSLTDVDKIVFCAAPPRRDEVEFDSKFREFAKENLANDENEVDMDFQRITDTFQVKSMLAEQIDVIGMQNVVQAYQNVRHADYGTSQAAKRSLFKFQGRAEDFNLFTINAEPSTFDAVSGTSTAYAQVKWMQNEFKSGVFVGKVPTAFNGNTGSEASIISSRLRSRDDPEQGTDLSNGFAGFICRLCGDGKVYECFIRTSEYETAGIEYVCKFKTELKPTKDDNKSINRFVTLRLPFCNFIPVLRRGNSKEASSDISILGKEHFSGKDLKQIGFRFKSADNPSSPEKNWKWAKFYLALSYIKVYRSQPEPEFVYLSDARIPPEVKSGMVRHDIRRIKSTSDDGESLFDEQEVRRIMENPTDRSGEELYFKYKGEEILKKSGLSYAIIRIPELNELQSGEFSTIELKQTNEMLSTVSRSEVAAVCVSALLDPNARNTSFYLSKAKAASWKRSIDENISKQFVNLQPET